MLVKLGPITIVDIKVSELSNAGYTNTAELSFDPNGMPINFITGWRVKEGRREAIEGQALYSQDTGTAPYIRIDDPDMLIEFNHFSQE